jgi:hypothetical protein
MEYDVVPFQGGCLTGNINESQLKSTINQKAGEGWRLSKTLTDTRRFLVFFNRTTHFLIFEREPKE